jgi:hypothetical protein
VLRLVDGTFVNRGPMQHGQAVHAGPGAVLDLDGLSVIVTSAVVPANDPAFFEHHGIRLHETRLLCVKAKNHFHAAFAPLCADIIEVDCPGPAMAGSAAAFAAACASASGVRRLLHRARSGPTRACRGHAPSRPLRAGDEPAASHRAEPLQRHLPGRPTRPALQAAPRSPGSPPSSAASRSSRPAEIEVA